METELITITMDEYRELKEDARFLEALRWAGVDTWSGVDYAVELFEETIVND